MNTNQLNENSKCFSGAILDFTKNFSEQPFVISSLLLVGVFYLVNTFAQEYMNITATLLYGLFMSMLIVVMYKYTQKINTKEQIPYYYALLASIFMGAAIFSASFIEAYYQYDRDEFVVIKAMVHAALNTIVWKIFFYITVSLIAFIYRALLVKYAILRSNIDNGFQYALIVSFCGFFLTHIFLFTSWLVKYS